MNHSWPKVQHKKSHIHTPPPILILVEHAGLMLPSSWAQLLLEHMVLHDLSWTQTTSLPAAASHPQSHHFEISPKDTPLTPHFTISWKPNKISRLQASAPTFTHSDLHWVSITRSLMVETQDHPKKTLTARPTPNLWWQEILGRITWHRCSSRLTSSVSSVSIIIIQPVDFRRANTEPSVDFRKANTELPVHFRSKLGETGLSSGWQGCSPEFPGGFALGKSLRAALQALGKPRPSLLFYLVKSILSNFLLTFPRRILAMKYHNPRCMFC